MPSCEACQVGVPLVNTGVGAQDEPIGACVGCGSLACGRHGVRMSTPAFRCIECEVTLQAACGANGADWDDWYSRQHDEDEDEDEGFTSSSASRMTRRISPSGLQDLGIVTLAREAQTVFLAPFSSAQDLRAVQIPTVQAWIEQRPDYQRFFNSLTDRWQNVEARLVNSLSFSREPEPEELEPGGVEFRRAERWRGLEFSFPPITPLQALWEVMNENARGFFVLAFATAEFLELPLPRLSEGMVLLVTAVRRGLPA